MTAAPSPSPPGGLRPALILLIAVLLLTRHLSLYYTSTEFAHFDHLVWAFSAMGDGDLWTPGPDLWETGLRLGGPLYYWLHAPVLLIDDPVLGFYSYYILFEFIVILLFWRWGRREEIEPGTLLLGTLALAVFSDAKLVICENMTLAVYLAVPLFPAFLRGLRAERARAMVLPGILLGAVVQVHQVGLVLVPGLLLMLAASDAVPRGERLRRLGLLALGAGLVVLLSIPGMLLDGASTQAAGTLAELLSRFSVERLLHRVLSIRDPLCVLGVVLVGYRALRRRAALHERLALAWFVPGHLLLSLALSYMTPTGEESRFALLNPARALLDATALVWLLRGARTLGTRLGLVGQGFVLPRWIPVAAGLAACAASVGSVLQARRTFEAELRRIEQGPCRCDLWLRETDLRHVHRLLDRLKEKGVSQFSVENLYINGPLKERLETLIHWLRRRERREARERGLAGTADNLLAAPALPRVDLGRLQGASGHGPLWLVPQSIPLIAEYLPGKRRSFEAVTELGALPGDRRYLMLTLHGYSGFEGVRDLRLTVSGLRLDPIDRCACDEQSPKARHASWWLFDLGPTLLRRGRPRLDIAFEKGELEQVWLVSLPPMRPPRTAPVDEKAPP